MKIFLEICLIVIAAGVPAALIGLGTALWLMRPKPHRMTMSTEDLLKPSGGWWLLQLRDLDSGEILYRVFRGNLVLGRTSGEREVTGQLYIGPEDYISRRQCILTVTGDGLMIRNLSLANQTKHNGRPVTGAERLYAGDEIAVGMRRYQLLELTPAQMLN